MTRHLTLLNVALALSLPASAMADAPHMARGTQSFGLVPVSAAGCPPGLAKKNPSCVPPGQAKKAYRGDYRVGDRLPDGFILVRTPSRYGLDPRRTYYERDGYVVLVDRETREILNLVGAISDLLN
ncbi:excinuclease ABC subunit A [Seohaeicola sp. SP36]|uniref:excinuclease ABC subunit A n=1 Tax=unclassified Seohaeicola TaxID=2641111 RepID=UPI00237B144D|nr:MULTISPECIES: excinuclease ABC subunit A [unclassified Seohaeicola]MDD9706145.1 excinuclease ABC subunit A [Seohaeicola sp. 4SK31]MDD9734604.1 excinuclease ABC subunit A [Seohaeicola sp. SP36]